jgi:hypothetical protein
VSYVRVKPGVQFTEIAPGGFKMLQAIVTVAETLGYTLTITSACDGLHSGPLDPHHRGEAYDIRVHDIPDPAIALQELQSELGGEKFYAFLESEGTENAHIHVQVRKGTIYP